MPKRPGRKSAAQTPAPAKERIYGSKKNPKGSAASETSAKSIKLSESVITSLKNKLAEFKKKHPSKTSITLADLKAVFRRGAGAYSSSHRPTITGGAPNSRNAWAFARVNKFLKKAAGEQVKAAYVQDDDLMKRGGQTDEVNTGTGVVNNMEVDGMAKGGKLDEEKQETAQKWGKLVNMSKSELQRFYDSEEGKKAGLSVSEAKEQGISRGRDSARMILKMKETPKSEWTPDMWRWAGKQINFINRMSGNKGPLYKDGEKTRKHTSLLIWGHNPNKKETGGTTERKSTIYMDDIQFNQLPSVKDIQPGQKILLKDEIYTSKTQTSPRFVLTEVLGESPILGYFRLKTIETAGYAPRPAGEIIVRSVKNIFNRGRNVMQAAGQPSPGFKSGGKLNPDNKEVKEYFGHSQGNAGGLLVGKRHSEGGIKGINKSTGKPLEVEGGEVVITRDAVSDTTKREFEGEQLTNREILSRINESGGGVSFADGGEASCACNGKMYKYGGKSMKAGAIFESMNEGTRRITDSLLIRLFEYMNEEAKGDVQIHKVAENMRKLGNKTLTMDDYEQIVKV
jgi:hypothetical protein